MDDEQHRGIAFISDGGPELLMLPRGNQIFPLSPSSAEFDFVEMMKRQARDITSAFEITPQMFGDLSSSLSGNLDALRDTFLRKKYADMFKVEYGTSTSTDAWTFTMKTYNVIRWLDHLGKAYHLPSRKLRKCQMRRRLKRMQRDRKRYR